MTDQRVLLAVLLNPPGATSGARTLGAVRRAAEVLGFDDFEVANLFFEPTANVAGLNGVSDYFASWPMVQKLVSEQMRNAGGVLAAWGVAGARGGVKYERDARAAWLLAEAATHRHKNVWMVGGTPRHPSRWHQYVADKHGRTSGGTFEQRLAQVLVSVRIAPSPPAGGIARLIPAE